MPEPTPAERWEAIALHLADAQIAARVIANAAISGEARRDAARRQARAHAGLVEHLAALRREGTFNAIAAFLAGSRKS
jgi:hypothetical protein